MKQQFTDKQFEEFVSGSFSLAEVIKKLGKSPSGGSYSSVKKRIERLNLDTSHFTGKLWNQVGHSNFGNGIDLSDRLKKHNKKKPSSKTKEILLNHNLKENKCELCGISEWLDAPITIQLHHINGDPTDDRLENLQMLCPNCHTQTDSYCKRKEIR